MTKLCIREYFVGKSENSELEKLSGRSRNMWKCIKMSADEELCTHVVWIHVTWEFSTTE